MKLSNHLIVTIPDFIRYFTFEEFWMNRRQFVRDMSPEKVYYWDSKQIDAYTVIAEWIHSSDNSDELQEKGLLALEYITGTKLDLQQINLTNKGIDPTPQIIRIETGGNVSLPEFKPDGVGNVDLHLHKIEFYGKSSNPTKLFIGDILCGSFYSGDFVYVTEMNGLCIEILPNKSKNNRMELTMVSQEGEFLSSLVVQNLLSGDRKVFDGISSFALVEDGYIFIDKSQKPITMTPSIPKFLLKYDSEAIYVKSDEDNALVLYKNGTLKSTADMTAQSRVYKASFKNSRITTNQL